jgi:hypothetical protein
MPAPPVADVPPAARKPITWELQRVIGSTRGRIVWIERQEPVLGMTVPASVGRIDPVPQPLLHTPPGSGFMGAEWGASPVQYKGPAYYPDKKVHTIETDANGTQHYWGTEYTLGPRYVGPQRYFAVSWLVPAALGLPVLPLLVVWRRSRWRRKARRLNLCIHCGYDLRANTERCPECGALSENDRRKR